MARHLPPNYRKLPDDELLRLKNIIERDLDRVKAQIDLAKAQATNGRYSDPVWFAKANTAKRGLGRESQAIQIELGERKKGRINKSNGQRQTFERIFMNVAKRRLKEEVYESILKETQEEVEPSYVNQIR